MRAPAGRPGALEAGTFEDRNLRRGLLAQRRGPSRERPPALRGVRGRGAMRLAPRALCSAARAAWRESFPLEGQDVARWFPGHMAKGEVPAGGGGVPGARLLWGRRERVGGGDLIPDPQQGPSEASVPTSVLKKKQYSWILC